MFRRRVFDDYFHLLFYLGTSNMKNCDMEFTVGTKVELTFLLSSENLAKNSVGHEPSKDFKV